MEQLETPTLNEISVIEIKKEVENTSNKQELNGGKAESSTVVKDSSEDSSDTTLKRKVKQELSSVDILQSPNKKPRKNIQNSMSNSEKTGRALDRPERIQSEVKSIQDESKGTQDHVPNATDFDHDIEREAMETDDIYSLVVSNFPHNWSFPQICNYITQSLEGISVEMEPVLGDNKNELRLTLNTVQHRQIAQNALLDKEVEGNKLQVVVEGPLDMDGSSATTEEICTLMQDIWEADPKGLYGLKPEYLANLKITPPIGNWVHVTNFRCDKSEMRDAFELAGNVVACSLVNTKDKYAKIMYSHPLEAVQAVSMLHDHMFYGLKLCVTMDKTMNSQILLPKGLLSIGPGLGEDGNPVREITREYERFLTGKSTRINLSLFTAGNINGIIISHKNNYATFESQKDKGNTPTSTVNTIPVVSKPSPSPLIRTPVRPPVRPPFGNVGPGPHDPNYRFQNSQMFRGPMQRGPMAGPMREMCPPGQFHRGFPPGPNRMPMPFGPRPPAPMHPAGPMRGPGPIHPGPMAASMPGPAPNWHNPPIRPVPQMSKCLDATTLKISNLPPTTSFPSLCGKLSTLAQVTSLEFTTPGCAVVKFASPSDAEKCFRFHDP